MRWSAPIVAGLCAAGCGGAGVSGPPEIAYGLDECSHCRMIISEERHAAAAVSANREVSTYDDIGCLVAGLARRSDPPRSVWVHDAESGEWIEAHDAYFVIEPRRSTPMGSGIVALGTEQAARSRVGPSRTIYDWKGLVASGIALPEFEEENRG